MEQKIYLKKLIAVFNISLMLWVSAYLTIINALVLVETAQAQQDSNTERGDGEEDNRSNEQGANYSVPKDKQFRNIFDDNKEVIFRSNILNVATSPIRRLKINAADRIHLEDYFTIAAYLQSLGEEQKNKVKVQDLPKHVKDNLNIPYISTYDRRLVRSIMNMVTPKNSSGAGNEYLNVYRITKDHRSKNKKDSTEAIPPADEEPRPTQHYKDYGKAVDVSEINYLRGTEAEIELEFTKKGEIKRDKNGKPHYKLISKEHKPLKPIEVAWQVDPKDLPSRHSKILANSPHMAAQKIAGNGLLAFLIGEINRLGLIDFDGKGIDLTSVQNIIELVKIVGQVRMEQELFTVKGIQLGKRALLSSGQKTLAETTKLPAFGFWGQTLDGSSNQTPGLLINMGREIVTKNLGFPEGALLGDNSDEILTSIGKRAFEEALGGLPVGTLTDVQANNSVSLEINVGRGILANLLDFRVEDIPLNVNLAEFKQKLSLEFDYIQKNQVLIETGMGLSGTGATTQMLSGAITPDAWLQKAGSNRLNIIRSYKRADTAFNIEERPELLDKFKELPGFDNSIPTDTNGKKFNLIIQRAVWALDNFTFLTEDTRVLENARSLIPPPSSLFTGVTEQALLREYGWLLNQDELRAWLLDKAFVKGFDTSLYPRSERFLAADFAVFKEVGIDRLAKSLAKTNDEREALRQYLRNDGLIIINEKTSAPLVDINAFTSRAGFRSKAEFDAVFINNAPAIAFESVGRLSLLVSLTGNEEYLAAQTVSGSDYHVKILENLEALKQAAVALRNDLPSNQRQLIDNEFSRTVDELKAFIEDLVAMNRNERPTQDKKVDVLFNKITGSSKWYQSLEVFYRVGHSISNIIDSSRLVNYRAYSVGLSKLAHGISGEEIYSSETKISAPGGTNTRDELHNLLAARQSPNETFEKIGGIAIELFVGTQKGRIYNFYQNIKRVRDSSNAPTRIEDLVRNFAHDNRIELYEFARSLGSKPSDNSGSSEERIEALARQGARSILLSLPGQLSYGSQIFDALLGTKNFDASNDGVDEKAVATGFISILSHYAGPDVAGIVEEARRWQAEAQLFLGRSEDFTQDRIGSHYPDMKLLWGAKSAGFEYKSDPDQMIDANGGPIEFAKRITGKTEEQLTKENPALAPLRVGQDYQDYEKRWRDFAKDKIMDSKSDFWGNPGNVTHLQAIVQAAGAPGVTVDALRFIFDKNMSKDDKGRLIETGFNEFVLNRINFASDIFDLQSFTYDAIALGKILTNPNIPANQKDQALQGFGLSLVDNITSTHYGFTVSWIFNDKISNEQKLALGMNLLTETFDFPPEVLAVVGAGVAVYNAFFVDKNNRSLDPNTEDGRRNLATVVNTVGSLSGAPSEYVLLASALLTGDVESTLITYAGQSFIDNQLLSVGITDISFVNIYEAYISPTGVTRDLILRQSWDRLGETINSSNLSSGEKIINPYTGETKFVNEKLSAAWKNEVNKNKQDSQKEAQKRLQYSLMDRTVFLSLQGTIPLSMSEVRGLSKTMFEGKPDAKLTAMAGLLLKFAPSEAATVILGAQAAVGLVKFFQTKDTTNLSEEDILVIDSWFRQITGWTDAPPGTFAAFLDFIKTGKLDAFNRLLQNDLVKMQLSGFIDEALGIPVGVTYTMWSSFETWQVAQTAYTAAETALAQSWSNLESVWQAGAGNEAIDAALSDYVHKSIVATEAVKQLAMTNAMLVSVAINLVFGKVFAQLEQALGLPSGTVGLLVTTAIYAIMVPGIIFAELLSSVILPGIGFILLGVLLAGSFLGGKKKVKKNMKVLLWSYTLENDLEKPKNQRRPGEIIDQTYARGKWSEEVDYVNPYFKECKDDKEYNGSCAGKEGKDRNGIDSRITHGDEIFLMAIADPQKFPKSGIFIDNGAGSFEAWKKRVADETITRFLGNLLTLDDRAEDEEMLPLQIATHSKVHVERYEGLINVKYGLEGETEAGTYSKRLLNTDQRKGVLFDTKAFLLHRWIHWQY